ncbi:hypothetical protein JYK14_02575 [Siccirubricoccus sp. KC 17139]|uniref:Uncharacterized protein n=1 Tax=Siccirubricoccus soli TaxID=2899147 RepID=A0ABT1D1D3_9PROT|nr:hypothetical protein [Siccirubricoccus soli]MCO6415064.1 hypothetical protein [Siccirubricoccus soli]MCP2681195.1 hypothetical protein [Siccirubricoccus soli]
MSARAWLVPTGWVLGSLALGASTQIGQMTPWLFCRDGVRPGVPLVALCLAIALAGAALSWRGRAGAHGPTRFAAALGALLALLLALPLGLQLLATLVLGGCEA